MSLTTYSQTSREITTGALSREFELAAARQHLREVYEDVFLIPVVTVVLQFVDGGVTALSKSDSMIQHSTFFGNATFVEEEAIHSLPTLAQLESETLEAFSGASKEGFIKKYHYLSTGTPSYFGAKYRYDVSVRKLTKNDAGISAAATQQIQDIQRLNDTTTYAAGTSQMFIGVMLLFACVLFGTLIGLSVLVRRRKLDRASSAQNLHGDFMVDEVDVIGSQVGSDLSLSPLQLLDKDDAHISIEHISRLGIDLSPSDIDDKKIGRISQIAEETVAHGAMTRRWTTHHILTLSWKLAVIAGNYLFWGRLPRRERHRC